MLERLIRRWFVPALAAISLSCSGGSSSSRDMVEDAAPEVAVSPCGDYKCEPYRGENCSTCPEDCDTCRGLCEPCSGDYQCGDGSGKDLCVNYAGSKSQFYNFNKFCARDCSTDGCSAGYECLDVFSDKDKSNHKQCVPKFSGANAPLCIQEEECDMSSYDRRCEGGTLFLCDDETNKVMTADCQKYGFKCGFSPYYKKEGCFGEAVLGEPCPEAFDCDMSKMDGCISVGNGLSTYCTIACNTDSDCPADFFCESIKGDQKFCSPK